MNTQFMSPREMDGLVQAIKRDDPTAERTLYGELDRLRKRIQSLELAAEVVVEKFMRNEYAHPDNPRKMTKEQMESLSISRYHLPREDDGHKSPPPSTEDYYSK